MQPRSIRTFIKLRVSLIKALEGKLSDGERQLAKAEAFGAENTADLVQIVAALKGKKNALLARMGMTERDFEPQYQCKKCNDTGFMSSGRACDCYRRAGT